MTFRIIGICLALAALQALAVDGRVHAQTSDKYVIIGSGGVTGVYFPVAGAICRLFNEAQSQANLRCLPESTGGSVDNLTRVRRGDLTFGVVQSDWQSHALNGTSVFGEVGADPKLRSVLSLYPEAFTVVARSGSGVKRFEDLRGKRINIGNPGSGQHGTMQIVMKAFGWNRGNFSLVREFQSSIQSRVLCDNEVDAIVFVAGHPSGSIKQATSDCAVTLVEVSGPTIEKLVAENTFYRHATIPSDMYRGTAGDVVTFGVGATLVTSADTPDEVVYSLVKSVFEHLDRLKSMHPALANLQPSEMVKDGLSATLHDGAIRYYREKGLL